MIMPFWTSDSFQQLELWRMWQIKPKLENVLKSFFILIHWDVLFP